MTMTPVTDKTDSVEEVSLLAEAMACDAWPKWLGDLVEECAEHYAGDFDMSTEQAIAFAVLLDRSRRSIANTAGEGQHTAACAVCGEDKPTPLRRDEMGGYVCLTCIDKRLSALTSPQAGAGEPVAWRYRFPSDAAWTLVSREPAIHASIMPTVEPLYLHPPEHNDVREADDGWKGMASRSSFAAAISAEERRMLIEDGKALLDTLPAEWHDEAVTNFRDLIASIEKRIAALKKAGA